MGAGTTKGSVLDLHRQGVLYDMAEIRALRASGACAGQPIAVVAGVEYALGEDRQHCLENWPSHDDDVAEWRQQALVLVLRDGDSEATADLAREQLEAHGWKGAILSLPPGQHQALSSTKLRRAVREGTEWTTMLPPEVTARITQEDLSRWGGHAAER